MLAIKSLVSPQRYFYALDLKRKREREIFAGVSFCKASGF